MGYFLSSFISSYPLSLVLVSSGAGSVVLTRRQNVLWLCVCRENIGNEELGYPCDLICNLVDSFSASREKYLIYWVMWCEVLLLVTTVQYSLTTLAWGWLGRVTVGLTLGTRWSVLVTLVTLTQGSGVRREWLTHGVMQDNQFRQH